jgi:hypothetical protein
VAAAVGRIDFFLGAAKKEIHRTWIADRPLAGSAGELLDRLPLLYRDR